MTNVTLQRAIEMDIGEWTVSKVAQIAELTRLLEEEKASFKLLLKEHAQTLVDFDQSKANESILKEAYNDTCDRAYAAEQKVERLEAELTLIYQAAQDGVCKKCAKSTEL